MRREPKERIPKFKSLEEEKKYWEARGPLAPGHTGRINKPKAKRSSFLVVRLTGEELTRLRDTAAKQGLGPSTFARTVLMALIERDTRVSDSVTFDDVKVAANEFISKYEALIKEVAAGTSRTRLPSLVRDKGRTGGEGKTIR